MTTEKKDLPPEFRTPAAAEQKPRVRVVLDLGEDTRPTVRIDGTDYPLNTRTRLTPMDAHAFSRFGYRMAALSEKNDLTAEEKKELEQLPDKMARLLLEAPAAVHKRLTDQQRMAIVDVVMHGAA